MLRSKGRDFPQTFINLLSQHTGLSVLISLLLPMVQGEQETLKPTNTVKTSELYPSLNSVELLQSFHKTKRFAVICFVLSKIKF